MFTIDVKKLIRGTFYPYPAPEFAGKTIRQNLEEIIGKSIVVKVTFDSGEMLYVCGNVEVERLFSSKGERVISSWAILSLWNSNPIVDIVWPPISLPEVQENALGEDPVAAFMSLAPPPRVGTPQYYAQNDAVAAKTASTAAPEPAPQMGLFDLAPEPAPSADDLFQQGYRELSSGHVDQALDFLRQAVTVDPRSAKAWSALGSALEEATRDDDAIEAYRKATSLDGRQWRTLLAYGKLLARRRRVSEAIDKLETALKLSRRDQEVKAALALVYAQSGKPERAAELMSA